MRRTTGKKRRPHKSARPSPESVARRRFGPMGEPAPVVARLAEGAAEVWRPPSSGYFAAELRRLGFADYSAYLASPHWAEVKRRWVEASRLRECAVCGHDRYELHHHTYARLGRERLTDLTPLCRGCHEATHALIGQVVDGRQVRLSNAVEALLLSRHGRAA